MCNKDDSDLKIYDKNACKENMSKYGWGVKISERTKTDEHLTGISARYYNRG